jgi:hypothetical protein
MEREYRNSLQERIANNPRGLLPHAGHDNGCRPSGERPTTIFGRQHGPTLLAGLEAPGFRHSPSPAPRPRASANSSLSAPGDHPGRRGMGGAARFSGERALGMRWRKVRVNCGLRGLSTPSRGGGWSEWRNGNRGKRLSCSRCSLRRRRGRTGARTHFPHLASSASS